MRQVNLDELARFRNAERIELDGASFGEVADPWQVSDRFNAWHLGGFRGFYEENIRGAGKTADLAWFAIEKAFFLPDQEIVIAASDKDQASLSLDSIRGYIRRNPRLARSLKMNKEEVLNPSNGSRVRIISSDTRSSLGLRPTVLIADELAVWQDEDFWNFLYSSMGKIPGAVSIVISNAGKTKSSWNWRVREMARTHTAWRFVSRTEPLSWMDREFIEIQGQTLPPNVYKRLFENDWEAGSASIPLIWIKAAIGSGYLPPAKGDLNLFYYGGLDIGLKNDRTALAICHKEPEWIRRANSGIHPEHFGSERNSNGDQIILDRLLVWSGTQENPVDLDEVEAAVVEARRDFPSLKIFADPYQCAQMIQRLKKRNIWTKEHTYSGTNIDRSTQNLYSLFRTGKIRIFDHPILIEELKAVEVVERPYGIRFDHPSGGHDDTVQALSIAAFYALSKICQGTGQRKIQVIGQIH